METACPVCGAERTLEWRTASASNPRLSRRSRYRLRRCAECGSAHTLDAEQEDQGRLHSEGTYGAPSRLGHHALEPLRKLTEIDRLRFLRSVPTGARVLEVGAGDGRFVELLNRRGYRARGIEPSPAAARIRQHETMLVRATLEEADIEVGSQDAVVAWHVLEHTTDPEASLTRIRALLRPGGTLVAAVPNLASWQARIGGDRWFHQDVPRHLIHLTPAGFASLLGRTGFELARASHLIVEHNALGMWQTLLNRITSERDFAFRLLKRDLDGVSRTRVALDLLMTTLAGALLAPIAIAGELAAGLARHGGTIVIVARAV